MIVLSTYNYKIKIGELLHMRLLLVLVFMLVFLFSKKEMSEMNQAGYRKTLFIVSTIEIFS